MNVASMRPLCFVLAVLYIGTTAVAQVPQAGWPYSMFERPEYDFGFVARGAEARYRIKFVNRGPEVVHVAGAGTRCACATARAVQDTVGPGETGQIEVTFDTRKYKQLRETAVIVTFDRPARADVQIPVKVYIRQDVVIEPGEAAFGVIRKGSSAERRLGIAYAGRPGWTIREVINKNPHLTVQLRELARNGGAVNYELDVTLKATAPAGEFREQLLLVTDDPGDSQIPVLAEGRVETEYSVTPELVDFGVLTPSARKTVNVIVRGRQPFLIETIESEKSAGVFEVRLPKEARTLHVLPLTVIAPPDLGPLNEEFSITVKGTANPLTFKAHCRIVEATAGR